MTTLYATDLDGTLLGADARLSPYTVAEFRRLTAAGANITFITARTPATVEPIMAEISPRIPAVVMTGAARWDFASRSYQHVTYLPPVHARAILDACHATGVNPFIYTLPRGTNTIVVYHNAPLLTPIEHSFVTDRTLNDLKTFHLHTPAPAGFENETVLFFAIGTPDSIETTCQAIRRATPCDARWYPDTYNPGLALLEVFAPGVSKAQGLLELKRITGADRVVAFGDNLNDMPMLLAADEAIVVDNAHPSVKAIATRIIPPNTADSVIRHIAADYQ